MMSSRLAQTFDVARPSLSTSIPWAWVWVSRSPQKDRLIYLLGSAEAIGPAWLVVNMSRFLLTVWPLRTHLHPFIAVAHGLRERGHEVAFYTGAAGLELVQKQGFPCFPFRAVDDAQVNGAVHGLVSSNWRPGKWQQFMLGTISGQLNDLTEIWKSWQPDAVLCDIALWGPILVMHELQNVPLALLSHVATCILPSPENPLPGANWLLKASPLHALEPVIAWTWRRASAGVPRAANKLRKEWGLAPLSGTVTEFTGQMPLYLVPGIPEFDGNRSDLPPSVRYVGPCLWDKTPDQNPPAWIHKVPRDLPRVIVVEGSIYPDRPCLLELAAKGLAHLPLNVVLVAGEGRSLDTLNTDLGPLAPNIRLERWTPLSDLLPIADVVVAGGDSETVMACLNKHVPMVLLPTILDQPEIAWRLSEAEAGIRIPRRKRSPERLAAAVSRVLAEPKFRGNAARLAEEFSERSGADMAARLLEDMVTGAPSLMMRSAH